MLLPQKRTKSVKKILRNTARNKKILSKIKRYKKQCLMYLTSFTCEADTAIDASLLIFKNLNLFFCFLDKAQQRNLLSKHTVSRKKSKLHRAVNLFFMSTYE